MILWKYELKKILFTQGGIWILCGCLLCKLVFLSVFPELKDERIRLTQKQYDKYLEQLYGENTPEKSALIKEEYETCIAIINASEEMKKEYQQGDLSEEEWQQFAEKLDWAYLHQNAVQIFQEKEIQFEAQRADVSPAHYIYEYGWQTIFTLQMFPDIFLLFGILVLAVQSFCTEMTNGTLPILLAARNGRRRLFGTKLSALLTICFAVLLVGGVSEAAVFLLRGWCNDAKAPLYSISLFAECDMLELSLQQGYLLSLSVRLCATLLFVIMLFGLSVWIRNRVNLLFLGICIVTIPLLFTRQAGASLLFTHIGLLCGGRMLILLGKVEFSFIFPLICVGIYSGTVLVMAMRRYQKGL